MDCSDNASNVFNRRQIWRIWRPIFLWNIMSNVVFQPGIGAFVSAGAPFCWNHPSRLLDDMVLVQHHRRILSTNVAIMRISKSQRRLYSASLPSLIVHHKRLSAGTGNRAFPAVASRLSIYAAAARHVCTVTAGVSCTHLKMHLFRHCIPWLHPYRCHAGEVTSSFPTH